MRKFMTLAAMLLIGVTAFAQIHIGGGYAHQITTSGNSSNSATDGVYVGMSYNFPISGALGVAPGLYFTGTFGGGNQSLGKFGSVEAKRQEHTVNIPIHLNYALNFGPAELFVYAGPTASIGLAANFTGTTTILGFSADVPVDMYKDLDYNRFDVKLGGGLGVKYGAVQINGGYDFGMLNRYKDSKTTTRTNLFHVGVAYTF